LSAAVDESTIVTIPELAVTAVTGTEKFAVGPKPIIFNVIPFLTALLTPPELIATNWGVTEPTEVYWCVTVADVLEDVLPSPKLHSYVAALIEVFLKVTVVPFNT
jgi:hypothetical protein